jgi:hypothetical protein
MFEERPKSAARPLVAPGAYVKVGLRGERFWCIVDNESSDGALLALVDNDLVKSLWKCGDKIALQHINVLETAEQADVLTLYSLVARFGSVGDAVIAWRDLRRASGVAVAPSLGTTYLMPAEPGAYRGEEAEAGDAIAATDSVTTGIARPVSRPAPRPHPSDPPQPAPLRFLPGARLWGLQPLADPLTAALPPCLLARMHRAAPPPP